MGTRLRYYTGLWNRSVRHGRSRSFTGRGKGKSDIIMDGGTLTIEYQPQNDRVLMTGPATKVFDGTINMDR